MKQIIAAMLIIVTIVSLVVVGFAVVQVNQETVQLKADLSYRSALVAESLKGAVEPNLINRSDNYLQQVLDRFADKERFAGLVVYDNKGNIVANSSIIPEATSSAGQLVESSMDADKANGEFIRLNNKQTYLLSVPLHNDNNVIGALMVIQNAGYIDERLNEIWKNNLLKLLIQVSLLSLAILFLIYWIIYTPVKSLVETLKLARSGKGEQNPDCLTNSFLFRPLAKEVSSMKSSLLEARSSASEEARLRLEKLDTPWTAQRLQEFVKDILKGRTIFMVSNREPYIHTKNNGKITYFLPASGMATAIEPMMQSCGGMWIAHGSGDADKSVVDKQDKIKVPPDEPKYTLKRIWLTEEEEAGYYYGFANEGLWPLCHIAHNRPAFRKEDWEQYQKVNQKFADTILAEIKDQDRPIVFIQDYLLSLVPGMVKSQRPGALICIFWHIPWPNPESFSICPWKKEILDSMLGADLIGFHTQLYCNNFIETVGRELESLIDFEQFTITKHSHKSFIKPFPISIAFPNNGLPKLVEKDYKITNKDLIKSLGIKTQYIGVGVDRLDYTKGILERLKAIEIFLTRYPAYKTIFTFIQIAAPTRSKIKKYHDFAEEVEKEVDRVNSLLRVGNWKPIILLKRHHSHEEIRKFYQIADFCLVTSLHDGMNLVAKEYAAERNDEKGVLVLSQFTGASRELKEALIVNPYNGEQTAEAIKTALEMKVSEQTKRMKALRETVKNHNVFRWSAQLLQAIIDLG